MKNDFSHKALTAADLYPLVARFGVALCLMMPAVLVHAQSALDAAAPLRSSRILQDVIPPAQRGALPTFLSGARISSQTDVEAVVEGNAVMRRGDLVIRAERLEYYQPEDRARARGSVSINRVGDVYEAPEMELKVESFEGFLLNPSYRFLRSGGHGEAERVNLLDEHRSVITNGTYTTCRRLPGPAWMPDWILRAASLSIDTEEEVGQAQGALLTFQGIPVLPIPGLSFPLSEKRKSGFLPVVLGVDNVNGLEFTAPYYWDIAPNRDATLYPSILSKRGVSLAGEFRYLESDYAGLLLANFLPGDKLRDSNRWGVAYTHKGTLQTGLTGVGSLGLNLTLNRVSDNNYWKDFTRVNPWQTVRLLPNDLALSWSRGFFSADLRLLKWQTLQDAAAPIVPPYDQMPQLALRYIRPNVMGFDVAVVANSTQFSSDPLLTRQPNGQRTYSTVQVSRPWLWPAGFITPKLQVQARNYQLDTPLSNGARSASVVVPTFSLDSGLVFERDTSYFGRAFRQTLEPRAFYVNTPFRNQNYLPNYDSANNDFNFASIFFPNAFLGNDRISDSDLLTLGLSTRLLDPATGAEAARFGIAQLVRFKDQLVTVPGSRPVPKGLSDVLVGASVNLDPRWAIDTRVQFNTSSGSSVRTIFAGRYSPGNYRSVSAAYRLLSGSSEQLDLSWQWPLNDLWGDRGEELGAGRGQGEGRWYSVGRMNYSLSESKLVDSLLGFEYDAGCWLGRIVFERLQTGNSSANQRIMFQLEFVGFSRVGANPLQSLKHNIPRYQNLRESRTSPSRFSNYD